MQAQQNVHSVKASVQVFAMYFVIKTRMLHGDCHCNQISKVYMKCTNAKSADRVCNISQNKTLP